MIQQKSAKEDFLATINLIKNWAKTFAFPVPEWNLKIEKIMSASEALLKSNSKANQNLRCQLLGLVPKSEKSSVEIKEPPEKKSKIERLQKKALGFLDQKLRCENKLRSQIEETSKSEKKLETINKKLNKILKGSP